MFDTKNESVDVLVSSSSLHSEPSMKIPITESSLMDMSLVEVTATTPSTGLMS